MTTRALASVLLVALACLGFSGGARTASADDATPYTAAELKDLVGPIALYPDVVIASLLPATTFPADLDAAGALVKQQGGAVTAVPEGSTWDPSVQTLLQFPDVLTWLGENKPWVEQMAFAVAVQQSEVMAAIQTFRKEVQAAGNLTSNEQQTVSTEDVSGEAEVIVIEPTNPEVVYVPTYVPTAVTQPAYTGWGWGAGFAVGVAGAWAYNNINWGGSNGGEINVNRNTTINAGDKNIGNQVGPNRSSQWNASNRPSSRPGGTVAKPSQGGWGKSTGKPKGSGVKPAQRPGGAGAAGGAARPGGAGGATRPAGGATRPAGSPSRPGGAGGAAKPATRPSASPSHGFSGAGSGSQARAQSNRGGTSLKQSGGGAKGGGSYKGQSGRSSSGGGGRSSGGGGRSGGGGSRGGGGGGRGGGRR